MPQVPNLPGVPPLSSYAANPIVLLIADVLTILGFFGAPGWDVLLNGMSVIDFDSVVDFEFKQETPISDYQVEDGGFQSYDKVQLPAEIQVTFAAGGSVSRRQSFLASIDAEFNTVDLYDIVTPEQVYPSFNFVRREVHKREAERGVGLIMVTIVFVEVRVASTATFTNTQQPQAAGQQNAGTGQPQAPAQCIQESFDSGNRQVQ